MHDLGIHAETALPRKQPVVGILLLELLACSAKTAGTCDWSRSCAPHDSRPSPSRTPKQASRAVQDASAIRLGSQDPRAPSKSRFQRTAATAIHKHPCRQRIVPRHKPVRQIEPRRLTSLRRHLPENARYSGRDNSPDSSRKLPRDSTRVTRGRTLLGRDHARDRRLKKIPSSLKFCETNNRRLKIRLREQEVILDFFNLILRPLFLRNLDRIQDSRRNASIRCDR